MPQLENMAKVLAAFRLRDLQRMLIVSRVLSSNGYTIEDLDWYLTKRHQMDDNRARRISRFSMVCKDCQTFMVLYRGEENDSRWVCPKCKYSKYSPREHDKEMMYIIDLGGEVDVNYNLTKEGKQLDGVSNA